MTTAVEKVCADCGQPIGLGRPFYTGTGVNRHVWRHAECFNAAPWKARAEKAEAEVARLRGIAQVAELEAADMLRTVRIAEHALGVIAGYRAQEAEMLAASRAAEALQVIDRRTTSDLNTPEKP